MSLRRTKEKVQDTAQEFFLAPVMSHGKKVIRKPTKAGKKGKFQTGEIYHFWNPFLIRNVFVT